MVELIKQQNQYCNLGEYKVLSVLGEGGFGEVFKCEKKNQLYAVKKLKKLGEYKKNFLNEIQTMATFNHENIVKYHSYFYIEEGSQKQKIPCLVMEYCEQGTLYEFIKKQPQEKLQESESLEIFLQICKGLQQIHQKNMIHRDLKTQNIVIKDGVFKISDFGLAKQLKENQMLRSKCGTLPYFAPEILERRAYSFKVDLWALGVILYRMLFKSYPFGSHKEVKQLIAIQQKTLQKTFELDEELKNEVSAEMNDFFRQIFCYEASDRISFDQMLQHKVFNNIKQKEQQNQEEEDDKFLKTQINFYKSKTFQDLQDNEEIQDEKEEEEMLLSSVQLVRMESVYELMIEKSINFYKINKCADITQKFQVQLKSYNQCLVMFTLLLDNMNFYDDSQKLIEVVGVDLKNLGFYFQCKILQFYLENLFYLMENRENIFSLNDWANFANSGSYQQLLQIINDLKSYNSRKLNIRQLEVESIDIKIELVKECIKQDISIEKDVYLYKDLKIPINLLTSFRMIIMQILKQCYKTGEEQFQQDTAYRVQQIQRYNQKAQQPIQNANFWKQQIEKSQDLLEYYQLAIRSLIICLFTRIIKPHPPYIKFPGLSKNNFKELLKWIYNFDNIKSIREQIQLLLQKYFPTLADLKYDDYNIV